LNPPARQPFVQAIRHGFDATIRQLDEIELSTVAAEDEAEAPIWPHS